MWWRHRRTELPVDENDADAPSLHRERVSMSQPSILAAAGTRRGWQFAQRRRGHAERRLTLSLSCHRPHILFGMSAPLIQVRDAFKTYVTAGGPFTALAGVDLAVERGEFVAVVGQSGSGKSTLLSLLAGIERPTRGEVLVGGTAVHALPERAMAAWRGRTVGIVFQFFQLLPTLTAAENVMLPMDFCGTWPGRERRGRALVLLADLGVADQADKLPATLSGGQQQRVAVARALANAPAVLLADEPTGNLDSRSSAAMLELLAGLVRDGQTVVMVTHEAGAMRFASRTVRLEDGRVAPAEVPLHA
jgi:putative ABC transport system ATP-binding protein